MSHDTAEWITINIATITAGAVTLVGNGYMEIIGAIGILVLAVYNAMKFVNEWHVYKEKKEQRKSKRKT